MEWISETVLTGHGRKMTFAQNTTRELWQEFMPALKSSGNKTPRELFSADMFPEGMTFTSFDPDTEFEKWAAVRKKDLDRVPGGMKDLVIPSGRYAVFTYRGKPGDVQAFMQYIFGRWLPGSGYETDDRPHLAVMGDKYLGDHPDSEEQLWIPVKDANQPNTET